MSKSLIFKILSILILIITLTTVFFIYQIYSKPNFKSEKEFVIQKGETVNQISRKLFTNDLIKSQMIFQVYLYLRGWQSSVQAGIYMLTPMNMAELAKTFVQGKVDNEISITLREGETLADLADELIKQKIINNKNDILNLTKVNNFKNDYDFLKNLPDNNLEGFLFPDTYRVYKDAAAEEVIKKMLDNFENKLTSALLTEIKAQNKSLYDILKMASILEKEIKNEKDGKIVAGILWKRLNNSMALQVDSSLKYIIGEKNNPSLTLDELAINSPYNTYKYLGLPPTPIGNPGLSAIRAAIYPEKSDYWYYLSAKETGGTIFAKTYDEHKKNIEKYLK
ncbi:hypothetical protein COX27_01865 [Candidatus Kuenenbacteria bacterium CG23_combo_of_CG06-09_8_20_14_all_36_9]|nr:MAG: hypothetical protein COX27_01865 [Candidatus Kuenenbacteria bacterium CG23_combo_of_CG06-09_8_20_14_all_36_9]